MMKTLGFFTALGLGTFCFGNLPDSPFIASETIKGVDIVYELENGKTGTYKVEVGSIFSSGQILATGPGGLANLSNKENGSEVRIGSNSILQWKSTDELQLIDGSILVCKENDDIWLLSSVSGSAEIIGECSFIAESTSNGGYKFICLSGKPILKTKSGETKIPAGRLVLVLGETNALGNAYDIDLLLLLKSSLLINAFEEPPATMSKIGLAVYSQQLKLKNKYNALIGDAPTDKNLQMWVLGSSQNKKAE
jgi:hypothetical protein